MIQLLLGLVVNVTWTHRWWIFFVLVFYQQAFGLPPYHNSICAAHIFGIRHLRLGEMDPNATTDLALQNLLRFRKEMPHPLNRHHQTNLWAESASAKAKKAQAVAQHLDELSAQYLNAKFNTGTNFFAGVTLKGEESIRIYLEDVSSLSKSASLVPRPTTQQEWALLTSQLFNMSTNIILAPVFLFLCLHVLNHPSLSPYLVVYVPFLINSSEANVRLILARNWKQNRETKRIADFIEKQTGEWLFSSRTYRMPVNSLKELWRNSELNAEQILDLRSVEYQTELIQFLEARKQKMQNPERTPELAQFVTVDQLYLFDPQTHEPELTLFLRGRKDLPKAEETVAEKNPVPKLGILTQ